MNHINNKGKQNPRNIKYIDKNQNNLNQNSNLEDEYIENCLNESKKIYEKLLNFNNGQNYSKKPSKKIVNQRPKDNIDCNTKTYYYQILLWALHRNPDIHLRQKMQIIDVLKNANNENEDNRFHQPIKINTNNFPNMYQKNPLNLEQPPDFDQLLMAWTNRTCEDTKNLCLSSMILSNLQDIICNSQSQHQRQQISHFSSMCPSFSPHQQMPIQNHLHPNPNPCNSPPCSPNVLQPSPCSLPSCTPNAIQIPLTQPCNPYQNPNPLRPPPPPPPPISHPRPNILPYTYIPPPRAYPGHSCVPNFKNYPGNSDCQFQCL